MHAWIKIKTILLFGLAMAFGCMGLVACQEPPPRQKVEPEKVVVSMKVPPSSPAVKAASESETEVADPISAPGDKPDLPPVLPLGTSTVEKSSLPAAGQEPSPAELREKTPPSAPAVLSPPSVLKVKVPLSTSFALEPYSPTDKINPFIPLVQTRAKATIPADKGEKKPTRTLTPLEKFDLSQIRLVAVVLAESGKIAMVEEASGKGYVVRVGTYIGKDAGTVIQILADRIVINETITDFRGEEISRTREMKLHKQEIEG